MHLLKSPLHITASIARMLLDHSVQTITTRRLHGLDPNNPGSITPYCQPTPRSTNETYPSLQKETAGRIHEFPCQSRNKRGPMTRQRHFPLFCLLNQSYSYSCRNQGRSSFRTRLSSHHPGFEHVERHCGDGSKAAGEAPNRDRLELPSDPCRQQRSHLSTVDITTTGIFIERIE